MQRIRFWLDSPVYFGQPPALVSGRAIVFFPLQANLICCGLAGLVALKRSPDIMAEIDMASLQSAVKKADESGLATVSEGDAVNVDTYLGGIKNTEFLWRAVQVYKREHAFHELYQDKNIQAELGQLHMQLSALIDRESELLGLRMGRLDGASVDIAADAAEKMKDIAWCLKREILDNIEKVGDLLSQASGTPSTGAILVLRNVNAVLNSIDRLEVRGRDSAGISIFFLFEGAIYDRFIKTLKEMDDGRLGKALSVRSRQEVLVNQGIRIQEQSIEGVRHVAISLVYKVAAEIGSLGDNVCFLREEIRKDAIFQQLAGLPHHNQSISAHTRWASVGAINLPNCHPVDNDPNREHGAKHRTLNVCLNGDIDNYIALKKKYTDRGRHFYPEITTDTKIIPLHIESYIEKGHDVPTAFRLAVRDFNGSHAILLQTDLAPGKLFLAQRGSGQAVFIGMAPDHYMPTSEVYGFVEETQRYIRMDGEKVVEGRSGKTQGQIFILDQESRGGLSGISACYYDGTPIELTEKDIGQTQITSRDIDRQGFEHYFLKEISESPALVARTLQNRWKIDGTGGTEKMIITLDEKTFPGKLRDALKADRIRRIFFVGQGTAGSAASACAELLNYYLGDPLLQISSMRASELSGFKLSQTADDASMQDTLVVAISQSGTTTDTNRAVDMVKERGAFTLGIINRRDSDMSFKVQGVIYPGSGRDIEMSVASTKALYSQIVAGAILGLFIAALRSRRSPRFVSREIQHLLQLPAKMKRMLNMKDKIMASAAKHAVSKTYWAAVGSGPNKSAADEIRIKLSELCYKTISSDCIEDKKHIDLSAEPLIIMCAAGTKRNVIGDIIKDTAIFKAHKAIPIVITDEGERGFDPYADDVFMVPAVSLHLAPLLNIMAGHIWGYGAALAINEGSRFFYDFRRQIQRSLNQFTQKGMDLYEVILEKSFREKFQQFYQDFKKRRDQNRLSASLSLEVGVDLILLLKYFSGRLPVSEFELDFGVKGTPRNMLDMLFDRLGSAINSMARPVDAIKHQAKTVTVGTSRIVEKLDGLLFDALVQYGIKTSQLTNSNILVLRNLQGVAQGVHGAILYRIGDLNFMGELTEESSIKVLQKDGVLAPIPSRVESNRKLTGTKRIIVQEGNVYIGKGRKDGRSIIVIPAFSASEDAPNCIEYLLLLNIYFKEKIELDAKIKALGGKYEHIKNIVQENNIVWNDRDLELVATEDLFGKSAEKVGEFIVSRLR